MPSTLLRFLDFAAATGASSSASSAPYPPSDALCGWLWTLSNGGGGGGGGGADTNGDCDIRMVASEDFAESDDDRR